MQEIVLEKVCTHVYPH